ncbi:MAG: hypothetical protein ACE361_24350 [Aureliella sp.]
MQSLDSTEEVNQLAILLLAEHYGIISSVQSEQVRAALVQGGDVCQHLTELGIADTSDLTLLRRKLADLQDDLGSEQTRLNHLLGGRDAGSFPRSEEGTYLQTSFLDDAEIPDQVQEDWQPGFEYLIDRYAPFLRIFDGYRLHLFVASIVLAIIAAIFWWPSGETNTNGAPIQEPAQDATSSLFEGF